MVYIDGNLKKRFHSWCVLHGTTLTVVLEKLISEFLDKEATAE